MTCNRDLETCNCDRCRYWRWEMTLVVGRIEVCTETVDQAFNDHAHEKAEKYFRRFLEREAAGEIVSPKGPFIPENGWNVSPQGVQWGGGPIPR